MRILLLDPPRSKDGRSVYQEECCIGFSHSVSWTSKNSFLAEQYSKQGHYVTHLDMRFRPIPNNWYKDYDVARILLSGSTIRLLPAILEALDPLNIYSDKIEILAAMLDENEALKSSIKNLTRRNLEVIDSRITDHAPLGNYCSPVSARLCNRFFYAVSSGCSYGCLHCPWGHTKEVWRPADMVVKDISWLMSINKKVDWDYKDGSIYLECAQINSNPAWLDMFASLRGKQNNTWSTDLNVLGLNNKVINILESTNCRKAVVGFEALDDNALSLIGKKHKVEDILLATELLAKSSVGISAHFLCGYGETPEMILNSVDNIDKMNSQGFKPICVKYGRVAHYDQIGFRVVEDMPKEVLKAHTLVLKRMESYRWPIAYARFKRME